MSALSAFQTCLQGGILLEVAADDMNVLTSSSHGKHAIGTQALNGCTCVVILGETAILLAHIQPYDGTFEQDTRRDIPKESHDHHEHALAAIAQAVRQHSDRFLAASTAWGIFACCKEDGFVQSIFRQVQSHLQAMGYNMRPVLYDEKPFLEIVPPKGEVIAYFNSSDEAELWLEGGRLWPSTQDYSER
ncbi:hypothetical protein LTR35_012910 [Friedmanniomyces endolithicus]|uniref:Uncharacterized protein n=1 Tax=Friedmanniomyces endolithicus TaxID=329885 RepID=A0AAN6FP39_9PEZI|nr:hypothetical protein LTR35_012910 [Friedmanniomyces endolithicus]KAK0285469.1 hypothetical protein LTS00_010830 [Friedmanniomyces endolithicus]KAK0321437.1 hypothetical protein LTR82_007405 [Friedmanniomyces endolithicus]KAK0986937.1 hypothetical protein LTR54_013321 [Friedmanniomyces endolithicus]